jgi:hypothetical protein
MTANFQLIEPGVWAWGAYCIEEETDADGDVLWYSLYRNAKYLWNCDEFATAVAAAEEDAQA